MSGVCSAGKVAALGLFTAVAALNVVRPLPSRNGLTRLQQLRGTSTANPSMKLSEGEAKLAWLASLDEPAWGKAAAAMADLATQAADLQVLEEACNEGVEQACDELSREEEAKRRWLASLDAPTWGAAAAAVSAAAAPSLGPVPEDAAPLTARAPVRMAAASSPGPAPAFEVPATDAEDTRKAGAVLAVLLASAAFYFAAPEWLENLPMIAKEVADLSNTS